MNARKPAWRGSNPFVAPISLLFCALGILGLSGCGGNMAGTGTRAPSGQDASVTLTSVRISPSNPSISTGSTQQFFATAVYSNASNQDVTQSAAWTSSDATTASVESTGQVHPGLAQGLAAGTATITATFNGKSGSTVLTLASDAAKIPLQDMTSSQNYLSYEGGLYPNSSNTVPVAQDSAGKAAANAIQPLDANGNPSPAGKIVFLSVGRSTEQDEFTVFVSQAAANAAVNHATLVVANGALSDAKPCYWATATGAPTCDATAQNQYDRILSSVLTPLGLTEKQVQVAWVEEYNADPAGSGFQTLCDSTDSPCTNSVSHTEALRLEQQMGEILRAARKRWPNLRQAFLSSRIYTGYATTTHSSEPYAFEYGFSVKWLIAAQINQMSGLGGSIDPVAGDLNDSNGTAPWIAWGPYTWADGDTPRGDGLVWCNGQASAPCSGESDYQADGVHPSSQGDQKASNLLMNFFLNSVYTPWFR